MRLILKRLAVAGLAMAGAVFGPGLALAEDPVIPEGCYAIYDSNGNCLAIACPQKPNPFRRCDGSED